MTSESRNPVTIATPNGPLVRSDDTAFVRTARLTGGLYLGIIACGMFSEIAVRGQLIDFTDAAATANHIQGSGLLFKAGLAADAVMLLCDVAVAMLLYRLLRPVNATLSLMAAAFRLTQAAILGGNLLNYFAPMLLLPDSGYAAYFSGPQRDALVLLFLDLHRHAYDLALLFFAVSNLILGYLVVKSQFMPTVLGYALQLAGGVYFAGSLCRFLLPDYLAALQPAYAIPLVAELSFCLWLLIRARP